LLLAIYFNMQGKVFYPLFSRIGQGDKETLPLAWLALGRGDFGLVPHPVGAVGIYKEGHFREGAAMLQQDPDGSALFLHLPKLDVPKQDLLLPPAAPRRWAVLSKEVRSLPPNYDRVEGFTEHLLNCHLLNAVAGFDVEVTARQLRRYLRCQPAWVTCCM
jgi:hypothetical protein